MQHQINKLAARLKDLQNQGVKVSNEIYEVSRSMKHLHIHHSGASVGICSNKEVVPLGEGLCAPSPRDEWAFKGQWKELYLFDKGFAKDSGGQIVDRCRLRRFGDEILSGKCYRDTYDESKDLIVRWIPEIHVETGKEVKVGWFGRKKEIVKAGGFWVKLEEKIDDM